MKFTALFTAFVLLFLIVIPVSATEIPEEVPQARYICDADGDGAVTATDARLILRFAVGIQYTDGFGWWDGTCSIYCDANRSGSVDAADARTALRIAVQLEKAESRAYVVTDSAAQSCVTDGYIKAECAITGETVYINYGKAPHSFVSEDRCAGKGVCCECHQTITFTPQHEFSVDPCRGVSRCIECNYTVYSEGHHKYSPSFICKVCDVGLYEEYQNVLSQYLVKNGEKTKDAYGKTVYVYEEADDYFVYSLLYYPDQNDVILYTGMAVEVEGEILYYESYYYIRNKYIDVYCSSEDALLVSCGARVDIEFVENGTGYGIDTTKYQSVPELAGQEEDFEIVVGSMSLLSFAWLRDFAQLIDFDGAELLFSNNLAFS